MPELKLDCGAIISPCQRYRYVLWRQWEQGRRALVVIGLNPSTADASVDDPTIRRCIGFAKRERCSRLVMLNLFAFRATEPRDMLRAHDPVGPDNDNYIREWAWGDEVVAVAAWGALGGTRGRDALVRCIVPALNCFGTTKDGSPRHPLYLRSDAPLVRWPKTTNPAGNPDGAVKVQQGAE